MLIKTSHYVVRVLKQKTYESFILKRVLVSGKLLYLYEENDSPLMDLHISSARQKQSRNPLTDGILQSWEFFCQPGIQRLAFILQAPIGFKERNANN